MSRIVTQPTFVSSRDWDSRGRSKLAAGVRATFTQAAAGVGLCNVAQNVSVLIAATSAIGAASTCTVGVIDGVSDTPGKYLWGPFTFGVPNVGGATNGVVNVPIFRKGSPNTAMTVEWEVGVSATIQSVDISGTVMPDSVGTGAAG